MNTAREITTYLVEIRTEGNPHPTYLDVPASTARLAAMIAWRWGIAQPWADVDTVTAEAVDNHGRSLHTFPEVTL